MKRGKQFFKWDIQSCILAGRTARASWSAFLRSILIYLSAHYRKKKCWLTSGNRNTLKRCNCCYLVARYVSFRLSLKQPSKESRRQSFQSLVRDRFFLTTVAPGFLSVSLRENIYRSTATYLNVPSVVFTLVRKAVSTPSLDSTLTTWTLRKDELQNAELEPAHIISIQ